MMYAGGGLKIKKAWIVPILWLFTQGCFSLMVFENYNPIVVIVAVIALMLCMYPDMAKRLYLPGDPFGAFYVLFFLLQIVEVIQCVVVFKQPVSDTLRRLIWISPFVLYFPIRYVVARDNTWIQEKMIQIGTIACVIGIALRFNSGLLKYIQADVGMRDGSQYVFFGNKLPLVSIILIISRLFRCERDRRASLIFLLGLHLFDFIYVMRFRGQMIGVLVALGVAFMLTTEISKPKKILVIVIGLAMIVLTDNELLSILLNLTEQVRTGASTAGVRFSGYDFMVSQWTKHAVAGYGGTLLKPEYNEMLSISGYSLSDLGIVGWLYKYGLIGLAFYVYYIYLLVKCSLVTIRGKRQINYTAVAFAGYTISTIMTLTTLDYYFRGNFYVNIFMFALISQEYMELKNVNQDENIE